MTDLPQVPRMADLMVPAFDALTADLPSDAATLERSWHANHGRYGDVLRGFRGQGDLARSLLTREIIATRLIAANKGQPLRDLAASEYFARLGAEPQFAIGEVSLFRTKVNTSSSATGTFLAGVIQAGQKFTRSQVDGQIPLSEADYVATEDVVCSADDSAPPQDLGGGEWLHTQGGITVPLRATAPGQAANTETTAYAEQPRNLFDSAQPAEERLQASSIYAAGGQVSVTDPQMIDFSKAMAQGFYGANTASAQAGARSDPRVRRVATALDYRTAVLRLYVADQSWATSAQYRASVRQGILDRKWLAFGGRIAIGSVVNVPITVEATIYARSKLYAADKTVLTAAARAALTGYFDDRPDFYTWHLTSIGGSLATAHPQILTAGSVVVKFGGVVASEPPAAIVGSPESIYHYSLRGLDLQFKDPGS